MLITFGDSTSNGFGADVPFEQRWPLILSQTIGVPWLPLGVDAGCLQGNEYNSGFYRRNLLWTVSQQNPGSIIVIYAGTADIVVGQSNPHYTAQQYAAEYQHILFGLPLQNVRIVMPNSVTGADVGKVSAYQLATISLAESLNINWIDTSDMVPADGIHLDGAQQRVIVDRLLEDCLLETL